MKKYITLLVTAGLVLSVFSGCVNTIGEFPEQTTESSGVSEPAATDATRPDPTGTEPEAPSTAPSEPDESAAPTEPDESTEPSAVTTAPTAPSETQATEPSTAPTAPSVSGENPGQLQGIYTRTELEAMDTKVNGWGLGPHTDDKNRPIDSIKAQEKYGDYDAYFIAPDDGNIYLTFDEGYENGYTAQILDVLKEKDVKAVFFITMQYAKSSPELVQRMIDEGHVVGNHSVRHKSMPTLSLDTMMEEVTGLHDYVLENFGYEMTLFRPPMGEHSQQSLAVLQELGYKSVLWSFAHYDYDPADQPSHEKTYNKIVDASHSGAIYLLHAVSEANTAVLGDVIDAFRSQGYELALLQ